MLFNRTGRYLLTAGKDSFVRLWDARTGAVSTAASRRCLGNLTDYLAAPRPYVRTFVLLIGTLVSEYSGAQMQASRPCAAFAFEEEYLLAADEATNGVIVWDVRMRHIVDRLIGVPRGFALIPTTAKRLTFALPFLFGHCRSTYCTGPRLSRCAGSPGVCQRQVCMVATASGSVAGSLAYPQRSLWDTTRSDPSDDGKAHYWTA